MYLTIFFFSLSVPGAGRDAAHDGTEGQDDTYFSAESIATESTDVKTDDDDASSTKNDDEPKVIATSSMASSKHDLHGTLAMNRADVRGLHTLATAVMDYMGQRVVAQSIIPGILQGEHNSKLVYGSVDGGVTIASDPIMHELMKRASKYLFRERLLSFQQGWSMLSEYKFPDLPQHLPKAKFHQKQ